MSFVMEDDIPGAGNMGKSLKKIMNNLEDHTCSDHDYLECPWGACKTFLSVSDLKAHIDQHLSFYQIYCVHCDTRYRGDLYVPQHGFSRDCPALAPTFPIPPTQPRTLFQQSYTDKIMSDYRNLENFSQSNPNYRMLMRGSDGLNAGSLSPVSEDGTSTSDLGAFAPQLADTPNLIPPPGYPSNSQSSSSSAFPPPQHAVGDTAVWDFFFNPHVSSSGPSSSTLMQSAYGSPLLPTEPQLQMLRQLAHSPVQQQTPLDSNFTLGPINLVDDEFIYELNRITSEAISRRSGV